MGSFVNTKTLFYQINGKWSGQSAGGCGNFQETHKNNPIYQFHIEKTGPLLIELRGPRFVKSNFLKLIILKMSLVKHNRVLKQTYVYIILIYDKDGTAEEWGKDSLSV